MAMLVLAYITAYRLILAGKSCRADVSLSTKDVSTVPTKCQETMFYSHDYQKCVPCSTCDTYSVMVSSCSPTSDTICFRCAYTSQPGVSKHPTCLKCPPCQTGEYMVTGCRDEAPTVCQPCPPGSYSGLASYRKRCLPCTSCGNRAMIKDCNASMDTECGACKKGYYKNRARNVCYACKSCAPGQKVLEECKRGSPGKLCSGHFFLSKPEDVPSTPNTKTDAHTLLQLSTLRLNTFSESTSSEKLSSHEISDGMLILMLSSSATLMVIIVIIIFFCFRHIRPNKHHLLNSDEDSNYILAVSYDDTFEMACYDNSEDIDERRCDTHSSEEHSTPPTSDTSENTVSGSDVSGDVPIFTDLIGDVSINRKNKVYYHRTQDHQIQDHQVDNRSSDTKSSDTRSIDTLSSDTRS